MFLFQTFRGRVIARTRVPASELSRQVKRARSDPAFVPHLSRTSPERPVTLTAIPVCFCDNAIRVSQLREIMLKLNIGQFKTVNVRIDEMATSFAQRKHI